MKKIKIFLASSEELRRERLEIAELIGHLNLALEHSNIRLYLVKWEYLDASMGELHKQEEYNKVLEQCDICIVLFATRFGKYTATELNTAYHKLIKTGGNVKQLAVFFKSEKEISNELKAFQKSFKNNYPEIPEYHFNDETKLKVDFLKEWNKFQQQNLNNDFSVIFTEGEAIFNGERILSSLEGTN